MQSDLSLATKQKLISLAQEYEQHDFVNGDPSYCLYEYTKSCDIEIIAFITAMLSFGKREQFLKKARFIQSLCGKSPYEWILSKSYINDFSKAAADDVATKTNSSKSYISDFSKAAADDVATKTNSSKSYINDFSKAAANNLQKSFYRFYSYSDMIAFFDDLNAIISFPQKKSITLGEYFYSQWSKKPSIHLSAIVASSFPNSKIVPKGKTSPCKRIQMFLRWMVRQNSPVDLGLWTWYSPKDLIIPLDTHVLQQSIELGLILQSEKTTYKTAQKITEKLKQIWHDDPVKGDFALFGSGVNGGDNGETCEK